MDKGYKLLFSNKEMVRDLIAGFVDPEIAVEQRGILLGEKRGIKLGEQRGMLLGEQRTKRESALRMLHAGLSIDDISRFSGLTEEEVRKLAEETRC